MRTIGAPGAELSVDAHAFPAFPACMPRSGVRSLRDALIFCAALAIAMPLHARRAGSQSHTPAPASVTIAGSMQSEAGCASDWNPACAASHLTFDATEDVWQGSFFLPAGPYEYKAALNDSWTESYPGGNIALDLAQAGSVKFYYSHDTHWITSNRNAVIATVPGNFQSELGCPGDWQPDCLQSWLQDPEGDGTYAFSTTALPAGSYEGKVAIDESWTENYGAGGAPNGPNIAFTVPFNGAPVLFSYDGASHVLTVSIQLGAHDNNISWGDLRHDSRSSAYRTPGGAVAAGTSVTLRLRALAGDLTSAQVRVWNDRIDSESIVNMSAVATDGAYEWWEAVLPAQADPTILWYRFIARDGSATAYYEDDAAHDGGSGQAVSPSNDRSWQLTMHDPAFATPDWAKNGIVYQIFPDRFRDGDSINDTPAGSFFYGGGTIRRSLQADWNATICDPREAGGCSQRYSDNFYGGDLQGVIDKLPYLADLGVTVLYLNPIFESPSNHKYDTSDYLQIDDNLGSLTLFQSLTTQAHALGMKVVLDGVFNHTSSDSRYFDRYGRFGAPDGACESTGSPYRGWYFFQPAAPAGSGVCAGDTFYTSWFGYDSLPKLDGTLSATRALIWDDLDSVARYWLAQGADGWRLDVGGDLDPGLTNAPSNDYWEGFRSAVRAEKSDAWIVGEEWGLATPWTLGAEWDATMNYQFSSAVLGFWRDETFVDNDHSSGSSAGALTPLTPSQLDARLRNLEERYPRESFLAMMNLLGSHDTNRALFMLDQRTDENDPSIYQSPSYDWSDAIVRLKGAALLQMTLPGAPTIYYGDEVGLVGPVAFAGGKWEDDPYNRQPYPWLDETGTPYYPHLQAGGARDSVQAHYQLLASTRNAHPALRTGSFDTLLADDTTDVYAFGRRLQDASDSAVVLVNRHTAAQSISVNVAGYLAEGALFHDVLNANAPYTVTGGMLTVADVPARSGALLVLASAHAAPPEAVSHLAASGAPNQIFLSWPTAAGATSYDVYVSVLSGGGYVFTANTTFTSYTVSGLPNAVPYYFVVVSKDDATGLRSANSIEATGMAMYDLGAAWYNVQWPPSINHTISAINPTPSIYSQIFISGATDSSSGPVQGLRGQLGYGPDGSTPGDDWQWTELTFVQDVTNNDEYLGTLLPDQVGNYDYVARYSADGGTTWFYGDLSGPARNGVLDNPGALTVNASVDTTPPAAPADLAVVSASPTAIGLSWSPNGEGDLEGYEIFRELAATPGYARIGSVPAATTTFIDTAVTGGETYRYSVKAYDTSFNRSAASNEVEVSAALRYVDVTFNVTVPSFTPAADTVYIVGNISELGAWNPGAEAATKTGATQWTYTLHVLDGTQFEYRFTRGSWETVEKVGNVEVGHASTASYGTSGTQSIDVTIDNWRDPLVAGQSPGAGATGVPITSSVAVTWSRAMPVATDFSVSWAGGSVAGTFTTVGGTTTFTPAAPLRRGTTYTVSVSGETSADGDLQQVAASWTFTTLCDVPTPTVLADGEVAFCEGGSVLLTSDAPSGNQWYRNGAPIAGATGTSYSADTSGSYTVVVTIEGCTTAPSSPIAVTVTSPPAISAGGPTTFCTGGSVTLTSSNTAGNQWYRDGVLLPGETAQMLVVSTAGNYTVAATSGSCENATSAATTVTVHPKPDVTIAVVSSIDSGASATASVDASCIGASFSWSIDGGTVVAGQGTPRIVFVAGAAGTLTVSVTVTNQHGCGDTKSADVSVQTAPFGPPPDFHATAAGTSAQLRWAAVQSVDHYEIFRSTDNQNWTLRAATISTSFIDTGLASGSAYLYRVRAVKADLTATQFSNIDIATARSLTDLSSCFPVIRAAHVIELRNAIDSARAAAGLSPASFADPALATGMQVRAVHLTDLRAALAPALAAIGVTPSYTDPTITPGVTAARAAHLIELQDLIR
jgi:glycosidase/fibronectin type 3 domain-containing protein